MGYFHFRLLFTRKASRFPFTIPLFAHVHFPELTVIHVDDHNDCCCKHNNKKRISL